MAKLIKRLIYPALVALFLVGVWVWYFKPEPGSAPTIPGRVDYIIFDGNFMYEAQRNDEPRHYLKIIRDRGLIQEISALFKGNKYRQTNCMCGFSLSLTFVQMPDERATWGFVRNYPFGVIHHWFAIKKILARERDPSFGEKFYSYEIELPDDIPTATVRAVLSDKDWIVLPQGEPEPTREVKITVTRSVPFPPGQQANDYDPIVTQERKATQSRLQAVTGDLAKSFPPVRQEMMWNDRSSVEHGLITHTYSMQLYYPIAADFPAIQALILRQDATATVTRSYRFRVVSRIGDVAHAEKALRAKLPVVIALKEWESHRAF